MFDSTEPICFVATQLTSFFYILQSSSTERTRQRNLLRGLANTRKPNENSGGQESGRGSHSLQNKLGNKLRISKLSNIIEKLSKSRNSGNSLAQTFSDERNRAKSLLTVLPKGLSVLKFYISYKSCLSILIVLCRN